MAAVEHENGAKDSSECGGEENLDYESDSDEGTLALALRRRVASGDEDDDDDDETNSTRRDGYYDDDLKHHEGGITVAEDVYEEEEEEYEYGEDEGILMAGRKETSNDYDNEGANEEVSNRTSEGTRKPQGSVPTGGSIEVASEEKKDVEPFVVPTAGAFYMHDDRFRYNGLTRSRRSAGGRRLWEAKDEKPWIHDRFEELKLNDEGYPAQDGRGRQKRVLGRGNDVGLARGKGNRESFDNSLRSTRRPPGRGRGVRRAKMDDYEFRQSRVMSNKVLPSSSHETKGSTSLPSSMQNSDSSEPITQPQDVASKKATISSVLKVSSPPFFPTGAALHTSPGTATGTSKISEEKMAERDVQQVGRLANTSRSGMEREMTGFNAASTMRLSSPFEANRGLAPVSTNGNVETGLHRSMVRGSSSLQQHLSKMESGAITQKFQRIARADVSTRMVDQSVSSQLSSRGAPPATQSLRVQPASAPSQQTGRAAPLATQSMRLQPVQPQQQMQSISQTQISSVQSQALVSFPAKQAMDLKTAPTPLGSNSGNGTLNRGTQAVTMQAERGSVVYGNSLMTNGLRGAVQFAGQTQAGLGVPAVLPGYANQAQFSFPNSSEVTWIPILASGGSLGSNYNPPYLAVDGGSSVMYYPQQTSQASAFLGDLNSSKTAAFSSNPLKTPQRTESDDPSQQRRRYSQMTFGEERR